MTEARRRDRHRERGSGLLSATVGVACVLAMIGLGANVAIGLWTRATVDAVAHDAARAVATAPPGSDVEARAAREVDRARRLLGEHGRRVRLDFERLGSEEPGAGGDVVVLRVVSPGVALLPRLVDGGPLVGALDRRIVVRREQR